MFGCSSKFKCIEPFSICSFEILSLHPSPPRFTLSTSYYGLSLNTSKMHPNPFISSFLSAAVEIPAYIIIWVALRFLRRKVCLLTILVLAGASLLLLQLMPEGIQGVA